jgi:hypothetical protein
MAPAAAIPIYGPILEPISVGRPMLAFVGRNQVLLSDVTFPGNGGKLPIP